MILPHTIAAIKDAARIEEVVGDHVRLKKAGANLTGLCPFHDERTPSFIVSPAKGIFKCFGCGKAGDSVRFVMDHDKLSYVEALKVLANKYGIVVEERELSSEEKAQQTERDALFVVNEFAGKWFADQLWNTETGKMIGLSYFKERGFTEETIRKFQLGYAPESGNALGQHAREKGFNELYLQKIGLEKTNDHGGTYDYFRDRVIFPIHNISGKILGFGGRILKKNEKIAKYLNSSESDIYSKSQTLYGIYFAKQEIIKQDRVCLVEGYTDVISLHQNGIQNVVASSGTSLTEKQIKMLRRFTSNVTMLFDGDMAGIKASFRGINMFLEAGMNVKVLLFPDGEDPDSFARKTPREELEKYIQENAEDFITFKTQVLLKDVGNDPIKKAELIRDLVQSIALIPDQIISSVYIKECARLMDINEETLLHEMNRFRRQAIKKENQPPLPTQTEKLPEKEISPSPDKPNFIPEESEIIRYILQHGSKIAHYVGYDSEGNEEKGDYKVGKLIISEIENDGFTFEDPIFQAIYEEYKRIESDPFHTNVERYFISHPNPDIVERIIHIVQSPYTISENWKNFEIYPMKEEDRMFKSVMKTLYTLKLRRVERKIESLSIELGESLSNSDKMQIIMQEIQVWMDTRKHLSEVLHRPFMR